MKTIFETCEPRDEVLSGDLRDEMFAARLKDVVEGQADSIYQDAGHFFRSTYPTEGLRTLAREVLGRISGREPANSPFVRLETSFGGGKSHNLIALYHLAQGRSDSVPEGLKIDTSWLPSKPWPTAGVVGSDMDPANGIDHGTLTTRTLWGEIAYQLGRASGDPDAAFAIVWKSDEDLVAPGTQVLEKLVGDGPALIMLDEIARYLRAAKAVQTPNKHSDLAEQTVAFLMTLVEFASSKPKVVVVLTLADSSDAFGNETDELKQTLEQELGEARRVSARQERVITPTGETEISRIVTHRLFKSIAPDAGKEIAQEFCNHFAQLESQGVDIPQRALRSDYAAEMALDYPFHPEFLTTLNRKTATIPNFQKTRGALRLLARVVRQLWAEKPKDAHLISVHHLDLSLDDIVNDLTSRLGRPAFRNVVEADITSPRKGAEAHAATLDRRWETAGKPPYARRVATNIFLHSLTQGVATGVDPAELLVSVLQPGDDPQHIKKTLSQMLAEEKGDPGSAFWFLHFDGHRYRFKTEANLQMVIEQEVPQVGRVRAKDDLDERIKKVWRKGTFKPVCFPAEAAELDDDAKEPKLVVVHYDAAVTSPTEGAVPDLVTKLFDHAGSMEGYRTYKNNVVFLVADEDHVERMVDVTRRHLAIQRIVSDSGRLTDYSDEQKKQLRSMEEAAELEVRVAITRAYRHLYYPSADAPKHAGGLARETFPAQDQGEVKDQSAVVLRVLKQLEKVLTADDPAMPPAYVKAKAWPHGQESLSTEDLRREFAKRIGLKILLDVNQLKKTVKQGCTQGTWIYYDATEQLGYGKVSPAPLVQLSEDATLYTPEEARRLGLKIKGEVADVGDEPCPLCGEVECVCEATPEYGGEDGSDARLRVRTEGSPGQVFQKIADEFHDKKRTTIQRLFLTTEGQGKEAASDARALGLAIPQLGKGDYRVVQELKAEFHEGAEPASFSVRFTGPWERYKRVKQLTDAFGQEATKVTVKTVLRATFPDGLPVGSDQFQTLRDVFTTLGLGKLVADVEEAEPAKEKAE